MPYEQAVMDEQAASVAAKQNSISVALATYNGASYLSQQLSSIASQIRPPDELVISDDASNDETINIVETFAKGAPFPVIILRNERSAGFRSNFMRCAEACKGDLVAFCDQDDIWSPSKLVVQCADFADLDVMLSCHNADLIDRHGALINRRLDQFSKSCRLDLATAGPLTFPRGFTQIVRRDLFKWEWLRQTSIDIGDPKHVMSHDGWLFFLALLHGSAVYHDQPLAFYRQHGENASGAVPTKQARFKARFGRRPADFDKLAKVWANRSSMLQALLEKEKNLDGAIVKRIHQAIDGYDRSSSAAKQRNTFYATPHRLPRSKLLLQALSRRDFRWRDPWAFPLEGAIKDVASLFRKP